MRLVPWRNAILSSYSRYVEVLHCPRFPVNLRWRAESWEGRPPGTSAERGFRAGSRLMHAAPLHHCLGANVIVLLTPGMPRSVGAERRRGRRHNIVGKSIRHAGNAHARACLAVVVGLVDLWDQVRYYVHGALPCLWLLWRMIAYFQAMPAALPEFTIRSARLPQP